jgi:zinc transport system ATP-binding protein
MQGVTFLASGKTILEGVDLSLGSEEIVTIMGPNGAGKTTLLKIAIGLLKPSSGQFYKSPALTIGYVPQKFELPFGFPLSVRRFLAFARRGVGSAEIEAVLSELGAAHLIGSRMDALSGGEFQRILIARALLRQPNLLILDEPLQGVDVQGQVELYQLLPRLRDRHGCGILMVSHDLHLVMAATDRVLCLNQHICCSGTPDTISSDPAYLRMYGHLAVYQHDQAHHEDHHALSQEGGAS